jgi:AraC family transcriptional regulator
MVTAQTRGEAGSIPVAACTHRHVSLVVGGHRVSDVAFAANRRIGRHSHPSGCIAVVVEGAVAKTFARLSGTATPGTVISMPAEEPHVDAFGRAGARLVVVEGPFDEVLALEREWSVLPIAARIARELACPDAFTPLALEGLVLELHAAARRVCRRVSPEWLRAARELALEHALDSLSVAAIAAQVGVDARALARAFHRQFGASIGEYVRNARLDWAAARLVETDAPLATLALEAGFADQSHFTRSFKRRTGLPPGRYRRAHR